MVSESIFRSGARRSAPEAACQTLYRIWVALDNPNELSVWDQLDSAWINISVGNHPYTHEEATAANFAKVCKREARVLLGGLGES
jgi:hypothetical protein